MRPIKRLNGQRFGRLTVIGFSGMNHRHNALWECVCDCGTFCTVSSSNLQGGSTQSCGCLRKEVQKTCRHNHKGRPTHGYAHHPLYKRWVQMRQRCNDPNHPSFANYGGRGIKVCTEWEDNAAVFIEWALSNGWEPNLQLDRRDNNKGYSPDNCRFVTQADNLRNRRPKSEWKNAKKSPT